MHGLDTPYARAFPTLLGVGVVFASLRMLLTAVTTHGGPGPTLFTTPQFSLPDALGGFTVGGPIELPILLQSAMEGFVVVGVIAVFGAFNAVVSHYELVQSAPRAFYEIGLVVTVALAFVPSTIGAIHVGARRRSCPHRRPSRTPRAFGAPRGPDSRDGDGAGSRAGRVDGLARLRPRRRHRRRTAERLVRPRVPARPRAAPSSPSSGRPEPPRSRSASSAAVGLIAAVLLASKRTRRARYRPRRITGADRALIAVVASPRRRCSLSSR